MRQQVHSLFRWPQLSRTAARLLCVLGGLHQRSGVALSTLAGTRYMRIRYIIRTPHENQDNFYCRADFYCRTDFFPPLKPRLVEQTVIAVQTFIAVTDFFGGMCQLETRFARIKCISCVKYKIYKYTSKYDLTIYCAPKQMENNPQSTTKHAQQ